MESPSYLCPRMRILLLSLLLVIATLATAQDNASGKRDLVQFSGVVVTGDSLQPVPFTNILIKNSYRGTMSDIYGYFSFVAQMGDTILFSAIGFQRSSFAIPDSLTENKVSMIHVMHSDTTLLPEHLVHPWPSKPDFDRAFLALRLADDDYQIAMRNLSSAEMMQRMENLPPDSYQSFQYQMALDQTKLYYSGGSPPINIFNPIAWAQFVQAWQNGDFKKKR